VFDSTVERRPHTLEGQAMLHEKFAVQKDVKKATKDAQV